MKNFWIFLFLLNSVWAAEADYGYLKNADQKYFKNDSMEGNNQRERVDMNVKEINKLHSEVSSLRSEVQNLKMEIEKLKKRL